MVLEEKDCEFPDDDVDRMTKMLSGANLPPIESLMDGDLQEWRGGASYHIEAPPLYKRPSFTKYKALNTKQM